jgi:hypothetical protein
MSFRIPSEVADVNGLFCHWNNRDIELTVKPDDASFGGSAVRGGVRELKVVVPRASNCFKIQMPPELNITQGMVGLRGTLVVLNGNPYFDMGPFVECLQSLQSTLYIGPFRNALNVGTKSNYFDVQVGQSFIQQWRHLKTGPQKSQNEAIHRLTDDIRRIFGFRQLEINPSPNDETLKVFVNARSYLLDELGAGLAQFIVVLANAAIKRPAFILIDEPELNLHPSLQLDFLTTLGSFATHGVIFATHSYGLARARSQLVYTLRHEPEAGSDLRPLESTPRLSELLGELSFSAYRELGCEKILLVEGVTEVLAIQQFLRMYQKDHKVVLLPLGGSQMINGRREAELEEITRITPHVHGLIDSEKASANDALPGDRQEFVQSCQKANIRCHVLDRRATENYLSDAAVKTVMGPKYRALGHYEALNAPSPTWTKSQNWRIARLMAKADVDATDLGRFFKSL